MITEDRNFTDLDVTKHSRSVLFLRSRVGGTYHLTAAIGCQYNVSFILHAYGGNWWEEPICFVQNVQNPLYNYYILIT